jgi:hypothetical protein
MDVCRSVACSTAVPRLQDVLDRRHVQFLSPLIKAQVEIG